LTRDLRGRRRKNESDRRGKERDQTVIEGIKVSGAYMAANPLLCIC